VHIKTARISPSMRRSLFLAFNTPVHPVFIQRKYGSTPHWCEGRIVMRNFVRPMTQTILSPLAIGLALLILPIEPAAASTRIPARPMPIVTAAILSSLMAVGLRSMQNQLQSKQ
jgi:hypothetical protein